MPLLLALVVGALGAVLGPTLARAAAVLHHRWPLAADLWERGDRRRERWRAAGCTMACGALFTLAARHWGGTARLAPHLLLFAVLVVATIVDLEHSLLPDRVVFPALGISVAATAAVSAAEGQPMALTWAALGAVTFCAGLLAVHLVNPAALGFGDVKVALLLGWYLGWAAASAGDALARVLLAMLVASAAGSVAGLVVLARRGRGAHYPFGPWLAGGAVVVLLLSPATTP